MFCQCLAYLQVIEEIGILRLDAGVLADGEVTMKDINQIATPFMLNAALPSAFLQALQNSSTLTKLDCVKVCLLFVTNDNAYL